MSLGKISEVRLIELPKIEDERGNLSFFEEQNHIPFAIKRVYWIYDVPGGQIRGGHAFRKQNEFIIALSGSLDIEINDGETTQRYHLNRSYYGLFVPSGLWRYMDNFSTNSVVLVVSSTNYDENDYIRDFIYYKKYRGNE